MTSLKYSVPKESKKLLLDGLIHNKLHASAPAEIKEAAKYVEYIGSSLPVVPMNWRFAESISAIKGFQAAMINVLLKQKYDLQYQKVVINTYACKPLYKFINQILQRPRTTIFHVPISLNHRSSWVKGYAIAVGRVREIFP